LAAGAYERRKRSGLAYRRNENPLQKLLSEGEISKKKNLHSRVRAVEHWEA